MRYMIARRDSTYELAKRIDELLAEDWKLQGGIGVENNPLSTKTWYIQALVK